MILQNLDLTLVWNSPNYLFSSKITFLNLSVDFVIYISAKQIFEQ